MAGPFFLRKPEVNAENSFDHGMGLWLLCWIAQFMGLEAFSKGGKGKGM